MAANVASLGIKVDSKGVVSTTKDLKKLQEQGGKTEKQAASFGKTFAKLATGAAVLKFGATVIANTIEQERVISQLNATLKSTGRLTPELSKGLQEYASSLQSITTFGDEAIIASEAMLLTFTRIGGETFNRAQRSILDVATALGTDLKSATIQVGKALNDPIEGMSALSRSGITFSQAQKDLVKSMVAVNDIAGAQGLILNELETQFEGSAEAARNTLGGAIKSLQNAFGDLLEGDSDSTTAVTQSINDMADSMNSPEVKEGFQVIVTGIFSVINAALKGVEGIGNLAAHINGLFSTSSQETAAGLISDLDSLQEKLFNLESLSPAFDGAVSGQKSRIREEIALVTKDLEDLQVKIWTSGKPAGAAADLDVPLIGFGESTTSTPTATKKTTTKKDNLPLGKLIGNDELTERNLILEHYNDLLLESDAVAAQVQTPQQVFNEQIELLNELRDTTNRTTGEGLISFEQYTAGVSQAQESLNDSMSETANGFDQLTSAVDGWGRSFADAMVESSGSFSDFAENMIKQMQKIAIQQATQPLFDAFGGFISDLIPAFADGTDFAQGGLSLVGERGAELVNLPRGSQVIPNDKLGDIGSGGGVNVVVNVDASGSSVEGDEEGGKQFGAIIGNTVRGIIISEQRQGGLLA